MSDAYVLPAIIVMAVVTYATRCIPLVLFRKTITNTFWYSFLNYTPYGVLAALIIPDVFSSTACVWSGIAGFITALILALCKRGLLTVSAGACLAVYVVERILEGII